MNASRDVLRVEHLNKSFGSLVVTDDVSLAIAPGERHVIIGPNGAGKTSLVNQIGGQLKPGSGRILLDEAEITGSSPNRISRRGAARTFQRNNLFLNLSVIENVRLALAAHRGHPFGFFTPVGRDKPLLDRARELMKEVHLAGDGARLVRNLSYGEQRQLEIAVALAGDSGRLDDLRRALRPRMATSPMCDEGAFACKMEAAFRSMWQHWCAASPGMSAVST